MRIGRYLITSLISSLVLASHAHAAPKCVPSFPYQQGWYGADSAASIPLPSEDGSNQTLWLFGDSFVAKDGDPNMSNRWGTLFLHNTVARGTCTPDGDWTIDYQWSEGQNGPETVFDPEDYPGVFYWPLTGVYHEGAAYVLLVGVRVNNTNAKLDRASVGARFADGGAKVGNDEGEDPFELVGTGIARVANPMDHARDWQIDYQVLSKDQDYFPAGAAVIDEGYLYLLGWKQHEPGFKAGRQFAARLPLSALEAFEDDLEDALEVYSNANQWASRAKPQILMEGTRATEMGLQKLPDGCGWVATLMGAFEPFTDEPSNRIYMRTAPSIEGPWSEERSIGIVPELEPDASSGDTASAVCYAAKTHPELSASDRMLYTYICNTWGSEVPFELWNKMDLYTPRAVSISLPTPGNADGIAAECPWRVPEAP